MGPVVALLVYAAGLPVSALLDAADRRRPGIGGALGHGVAGACLGVGLGVLLDVPVTAPAPGMLALWFGVLGAVVGTVGHVASIRLGGGAAAFVAVAVPAAIGGRLIALAVG